MRVMLLKGQSVYDALRVFIDTLADAFTAQGHEVAVFDVTQPSGSVNAMEAYARENPVDLLFSFNIAGEFRDPAGRTLAQIVGAPHVVQQVDYPLTHAKKLDGFPPETALLVIDRSHVDAVRSTYGRDRFRHVAFSPHAAIGDAPRIDADAAAFAGRRIPILFTGTFYKPGGKTWADLPANVGAILDGAVEIALAGEWTPALDALDQAMRDKGLDPHQANLAGFRRLAALVHEYVRTTRRFELLNAAAEAGLPLHVYGRGYDEHLERFKNITFGGEADLPAAVELMRSSRIVLNINANFGAGSHERPFTALLAGAVAATDYSRFYADAFKDGEEIVFYRWKSLRPDLERIGALADDPDRAFAIAQAGQKRVAAEHLWANRIPAIVAAAQAVRA